MYQKMFETQTQWGEQQESKAALFRTFAVDLGLDMDAYDSAVADPATQERVQSDFDAGLSLGVQGTPTFFVNHEKVELRSTDDLNIALDRALAE
jgi:protein-disulfide isomerase